MSELPERPDVPQETHSGLAQAWASAGEAAQQSSEARQTEQETTARATSGTTPAPVTYSVLPAGGAFHVKRGDEVVGYYVDRDAALADARKLAAGDSPSRVVIHDDDRRPSEEETY
ncbi:DUF2188 domain-containing protein [Actinopolymorpha rutila]|uniref:Uncharacterized protein n=1 Tax=Actinopolymorpha rutila TaxID=446787 RepID=A0A852ZCX3_9ACTN|nr:DUF2188 domain-containing protein [Actinopolymorpha rutila]NYH90754.1 hypothetical protein [Actinopolymorpha rutila]